MKIIIYFRNLLKKNFSLLKLSLHLLETKSPHSKKHIQISLFKKKPTWNLLLQVVIQKLMHNSEKTSYQVDNSTKHSMIHNFTWYLNMTWSWLQNPSTLCRNFVCEIKLHGEWKPIPS